MSGWSLSSRSPGVPGSASRCRRAGARGSRRRCLPGRSGSRKAGGASSAGGISPRRVPTSGSSPGGSDYLMLMDFDPAVGGASSARVRRQRFLPPAEGQRSCASWVAPPAADRHHGVQEAGQLLFAGAPHRYDRIRHRLPVLSLRHAERVIRTTAGSTAQAWHRTPRSEDITTDEAAPRQPTENGGYLRTPFGLRHAGWSSRPERRSAQPSDPVRAGPRSTTPRHRMETPVRRRVACHDHGTTLRGFLP